MLKALTAIVLTFLLTYPALPPRASGPHSNKKPHRCLVLDLDNKTLLYKADVAFSDGSITHTDAHGYFLLPDTFSYVIVAKDGYIRQRVSREELGDTLFLPNASHCLPELTVVARAIPKNINNRFRLNKKDLQLIGQGQQLAQGFGIPLQLLFEPIIKHFEKKKRQKEENSRQILDNY